QPGRVRHDQRRIDVHRLRARRRVRAAAMAGSGEPEAVPPRPVRRRSGQGHGRVPGTRRRQAGLPARRCPLGGPARPGGPAILRLRQARVAAAGVSLAGLIRGWPAARPPPAGARSGGRQAPGGGAGGCHGLYLLCSAALPAVLRGLYVLRSASVGASRAALSDGHSPAVAPAGTAAAQPPHTAGGGISGDHPYHRAAPTVTRVPASTPDGPPRADRTSASSRNCPPIWARVAPSARRNPISGRRSSTEITMTLAIPSPPARTAM